MSDASGQDQTGRPNWKTTFNFLFRTDQGVVSADVWWRGTIALAAALLFLHFVWEAISSQPQEPLSERGGLFDPMIFASYLYLTFYGIMIILIAVLGLVVVNAMRHSPWATSTVATTIPIAILIGLFMRHLRPGRVLEGSAIGVVLLRWLYPRRLAAASVVGSDLAHAIPLTLLAGCGYLSMGYVQLPVLGWLLAGSVPGVVAGSLLPARLQESTVRRALGLLLLVVGVRTLAASVSGH